MCLMLLIPNSCYATLLTLILSSIMSSSVVLLHLLDWHIFPTFRTKLAAFHLAVNVIKWFAMASFCSEEICNM